MRYLGGGIGHLEQFPPTDNGDDNNVRDNSNIEVETDDFAATEDATDDGSGDESEGESEDEGGDGGNGGGDEDEGEGGNEDVDEEDLDEETGNVY